jgi:predicted NBD/HSP70 family sugar kinase
LDSRTTPAPRRGMAADELRRHNLATVLERVHLSGPLSRSDLTVTTGLNRSTIADLVGELSSLGLVEEHPAVRSAGPGRPSPLVGARPESAAVLALELSVDSIAVATAGLGGHLYNKLRVARPRERFSPRETVQDLAKLAEPLLASLPSGHNLAGVGAAVAGVVRRSDGFVHLAPNLGWHNVPLGSMLGSELGVSERVSVANEADLGALAEHRRGVGVGVGHLIYLSGEVGIGAGIIYDGKPMLGCAGYAGEVGHTLINPAGRRCRCGATGCWETEAGEMALARAARLPSSITGLDVVRTVRDRAETGDQRTLSGIAEIGRWLGLGIGSLINTFNPELIVLGGIYHALFPYVRPSVLEGAAMVRLDAPAEMVEVIRSGLGRDAPLIGAAELALSAVVTDPASAAGHSVLAAPTVGGGG